MKAVGGVDSRCEEFDLVEVCRAVARTQAIWQRGTTCGAMMIYTSRPRIECVIQTSSSQGGEALLTAAHC